MSCAATATSGATAAVNQTAAAAEPQMITVKDTLASPTSHLYSEKIRISRDAAIFEIKRENCCLPEGTSRYSSRYEIYNSTTRPFGKSYRELTLTNCSSSTSGGCETGSTSSSCCSETTTYVTCSSEIEPVQMTGFHQHHHHHHEDGELYSSCSSPIATLEVNGGTYGGGGDVKENYDDDMTEIQIEGKIVSRLRGQADEEITEEVRGEQSELLLKQELKSELERKQRRLESDLKQAGKDDTPARKTFDDEVNAATEKSVVKIETWRSSSSSANGVDNVIIAQRRQQPLQSPKLLKEMIKTYEHNNNDKGRQSAKLMDDNFKEEEQHIYEPKSTKTNKIVTRCKSLLNLDLNQLQQQPEQEQGIYKKIGKATSEVNLIHDEKYESARQTDDTTVDDQTKEVVVNGNEIVEDKETSKKTINIAIVNNKKYPKIQLEDKFEKRMNDLLTRKKHASESASAINEALANDVIVVEPTRTRRSADNNKFDSRPISSSHLNCRVTGELWKNKTVSGSFEQRYGDLCTLPRTAKSHRSQLQRHFYYHTGRPKSALKDEELPDPDKVKYARDLFENVLKFKPYSAESPTGTTKYNTISSWKPKYQTNHNIMAEELQQPRHVVDHRKVRRTVTLETDQPTAINNNNNNNNNNTTSSIGKWIDDRRSVSSGVGSDVSGEMDTDSNPRGADTSSDCSNKEESVFSSEDDEQSNKADKELNCLGQPVSSDILEKIRAFGTSVTYYGGRIVAASEGHACSPMTMTIMDEIRQHAMQDRLKAAGREQADDDDDYDESRRSTTFDERYFSVKFELRKSISCDSRLEQSGVERIIHERPHFTFVNNDPIKTESKHSVAKCRLQSSPLPSSEIVTDAITEENERVDDEQLKKPDPISKYSATTTSSNDYGDIEFEEFQVLDEDQPSPPKLE